MYKWLHHPFCSHCDSKKLPAKYLIVHDHIWSGLFDLFLFSVILSQTCTITGSAVMLSAGLLFSCY